MGMKTGTERVQNGYRMDTEPIQKGNGMDTERVQNGNRNACRMETERVLTSIPCYVSSDRYCMHNFLGGWGGYFYFMF